VELAEDLHRVAGIFGHSGTSSYTEPPERRFFFGTVRSIARDMAFTATAIPSIRF